jgi:hypothetical protein
MGTSYEITRGRYLPFRLGLESHATWQIRTFWIMLISSVISAGLAAT